MVYVRMNKQLLPTLSVFGYFAIECEQSEHKNIGDNGVKMGLLGPECTCFVIKRFDGLHFLFWEFYKDGCTL